MCRSPTTGHLVHISLSLITKLLFAHNTNNSESKPNMHSLHIEAFPLFPYLKVSQNPTCPIIEQFYVTLLAHLSQPRHYKPLVLQLEQEPSFKFRFGCSVLPCNLKLKHSALLTPALRDQWVLSSQGLALSLQWQDPWIWKTKPCALLLSFQILEWNALRSVYSCTGYLVLLWAFGDCLNFLILWLAYIVPHNKLFLIPLHLNSWYSFQDLWRNCMTL